MSEPTPTTPTPPLLVDERGAAKLLSLSARTVFTLATRGQLRPIRVGRAKRYAVDDLRAWIARQQVAGQVRP
jgi:excisionase family DNA binding protein